MLQTFTDFYPASQQTIAAGTETRMKLAYTLITGDYGGGELPPYTAYGIEIRLSRPGKKTEVARVEDITTDRAEADKLLALLRRNDVTPVTLQDVIEDTLGV